MDDSSDSTNGYRSLVDGSAPVLKGFDDAESEAQWVIEEIERLHEAGRALEDICIVGRTRTQLKHVQAKLDEAGHESRLLSADQQDDHRHGGVRLANMHRIKGLEFRVVFLVGINRGVVPLEWAVAATDDPVEKKAREANERALLHVAASRAIGMLCVSWCGERSSMLGQGA